MFFRIVSDSFTRKPRRKILTAAALALGMAVATATLEVALDVGDRLAREFRSLGANLLVTPASDTLPLEIGGVDYRPVDAGAYLPAADLGKLKTIFWRNNVMGFAPFLDVPVAIAASDSQKVSRKDSHEELIGTWYSHSVSVPDGGTFTTGISATDPWWHVDGRWFSDGAEEGVAGSSLAQRLHLRAGSKIKIDAGSRTHTLTITGIVSTGGREDNSILAPIEIAQDLAGRPGEYRQLLVSALTKPADSFSERDPASMTPVEYDRWYCSPYISSISHQIQQQLPGVDVRAIRQVAEGEGRILTRVSGLMWMVTIAALFAAALAVGATSATTVLERRLEIGLMKALGASRRAVSSFFIAEQLFLAVVGGLLGYALGILLARALGIGIFGVAPELRWILLPIVLALAAVVALLGSLLPLGRASRVDPAPILRGE
ncbi:MAG TPA: ABC transporter permease [Candidatus Saccharimonadales bacterium]|jgi:putative ABC transport system permease protein|nr:ABC transporter permease [Candidatus Saccharimonadales bacterium]